MHSCTHLYTFFSIMVYHRLLNSLSGLFTTVLLIFTGVRKTPLEKEMAAHLSVLAWEIPWTEEPGGLRSMGSKKAGHN